MKKYYIPLIAFFLSLSLFVQAQERTTETFESDVFPPKNWSIQYAHPRPHSDNLMSLSNTEKFGSSGFSFRFSSSQNQQTTPYIQYLISPELNVEIIDTFSLKYYVPGSGSRYFKIGWSSTSTEISAFTWSSQITAEDYEYGGYWKDYSKKDIPIGTKYICIQYCPTSASINTYFYIDNVKLPPLALVACNMPASLTFNAQTTSVSWTETGTAGNWEIVYGNVESFDMQTATVHSATTNTKTLQNTSPLTTYVAYVRSVCDEEQKSAWSAPLYFRTGCPAYYELPWFEGFENIAADNIMPDCQAATSTMDFATKKGSVTYNFYENRKPHTGKNFAFFKNNTAKFKTMNWYFSSPLNIKAGSIYKISFWYICEEGNTVDSLAIGIGKSQSANAMEFISVKEKLKNTDYREFTTTFTAQEDGPFYMGIYYSGLYSGLSADTVSAYLSIDDLSVKMQTSFEPPINLFSDKYKISDSSAELVWTEVSGASQWELSVGRSDTDFSPADSVITGITTTLYTLGFDAKGNALSPNLEYRVYVRSIKDEEKSEWTGPILIKTLKQTVSQLPLLEDFATLAGNNKMTENTHWISRLEGRMKTSNSNDTYNKRYGRNDAKYLYTSLPNTVGGRFEEWVILKGAHLSAGVSYDFVAWLLTNEKKGIDTVEFRIGNSPYPEKMSRVLLKEANIIHSGYKEFFASYIPNQDEIVYLGIRIVAHSETSFSSNNAILTIDDIQIKKTPSCRAPYDVSVVQLYIDSAQIVWQHDETLTNWTLAISEGKTIDLQSPDTVISIILDQQKSYLISGLLPSTEYTIALKANCEEGLSSIWSIPKPFKTLCATHSSFPLNEGFEAYSSSCWSSQAYRDGSERPSAQWNSYKGSSSYAGMDVEPFEGDSSLRFRSSFEDNKSYGELISPELQMGSKEISSLEFYWWNKGSCTGDDESGLYPFPTKLYLSYTLNGSDYIMFDSINACGCANSRTAYRKYERIFPHTVKRYKIKAVGNFGSSNTHVDALSIKTFDTADICAPSHLQALVQQTDISLSWNAIPAGDHSLMKLKYYEIKRNGVVLDTTSKLSYIDKSLAKGSYSYGVYAVYASGLQSQSVSVQAQITVETFQVIISKNEVAGVINPLVGAYNYVEGSSLSLSAQGVNLFTEFKYWVINTTDTIRSAQTTLTVNKAMTIKAVFAEILYDVNISLRGKGEVQPQAGSVKYKGGTTLNLTASPQPYWEFKYWIINQDSVSQTNLQASVSVTENLNITAVFAKIPYTLTLRKDGEGSTTPSLGTHNLYAGDTIALDAQASKGHKFIKWIISTQSVNEKKHSFILERHTTVTAYFEELPDFIVAISKEGEGVVSPLAGSYTYKEGDTLKLSAQGAEFHSFEKWVVNGKTILVSDTSLIVKENLQAQAYFTKILPKKYTLNILKIGQGGLTPEEGVHEYTEGENVNLQALAAENWVFVAWVINGDSIKTPQTLWTANADATALALFHEQVGLEKVSQAGVDMYPNPLKDDLYIRTELGLSHIEIYSFSGQKLYTRQYSGETHVHLSLSSLTEGMYFVKVITNNKAHYVRKLIKK